MTKPMTNKEYVQADGAVCPFCRSDEITTAGTLEADGAGGTQNIRCENCGRQWWDVYDLKGYIPDEEAVDDAD